MESTYSASRWHSGDVMVGNITFLMISVVFDPSQFLELIVSIVQNHCVGR